MARTAESTIYKHTKGQTFYLTIPSVLASDSTFPFKEGEKVLVEVEGDTLVISKK